MRGNIKTRVSIAQGKEVDAVVVAMAALNRLGLTELADHIFAPDQMVPQVGQGAIAVECREEDEQSTGHLRAVVDQLTARFVTAERSYLAELGGGCELPVGAYAYEDEGVLRLDTVLASTDGEIVLRTKREGDDPTILGAQTAQELLASGGYNMLARGGGNS